VWPDASHGVGRADAWRGSMRRMACGVLMPGVRRGDAWRYKAGGICARHGRYSVGPCPALQSNQSRGWLCLPDIAITRAAAAVMIVISH